ncbi:uncharacterized protein LOC143917888 [Arctopsyche grandis]|uniref:uncharacterized protein LOC143917888 n=1 Tax=Arctopsyche grandis TaxID=121162 RepID=UPI00406D85C9
MMTAENIVLIKGLTRKPRDDMTKTILIEKIVTRKTGIRIVVVATTVTETGTTPTTKTNLIKNMATTRDHPTTIDEKTDLDLVIKVPVVIKEDHILGIEIEVVHITIAQRALEGPIPAKEKVLNVREAETDLQHQILNINHHTKSLKSYRLWTKWDCK